MRKILTVYSRPHAPVRVADVKETKRIPMYACCKGSRTVEYLRDLIPSKVVGIKKVT